jgi:predicted negative regulator of RcsB-dependent stress response
LNPRSAVDILDRAARLATDAGDDWCTAFALIASALSLVLQGALPAVSRRLALAEDLVNQLGNQSHLVWNSLVAAMRDLRAGELDTAAAHAEQSRRLAAQSGEPISHAWAIQCLAEIACARGQASPLRDVLALLDAELDQSPTAPAAAGHLLLARGRTALALGRYAQARSDLEAGIAAAHGERISAQ